MGKLKRETETYLIVDQSKTIGANYIKAGIDNMQ